MHSSYYKAYYRVDLQTVMELSGHLIQLDIAHLCTMDRVIVGYLRILVMAIISGLGLRILMVTYKNCCDMVDKTTILNDDGNSTIVFSQ
jgi:hypothetical protein